MAVPRIGDIVATDDAHVLITSPAIGTYGTAHGFIIGSSDPTAHAEVHHGTADGRTIAGTDRTREIAEHMKAVGYRPSQIAAVNAELAVLAAGR